MLCQPVHTAAHLNDGGKHEQAGIGSTAGRAGSAMAGTPGMASHQRTIRCARACIVLQHKAITPQQWRLPLSGYVGTIRAGSESVAVAPVRLLQQRPQQDQTPVRYLTICVECVIAIFLGCLAEVGEPNLHPLFDLRQ